MGRESGEDERKSGRGVRERVGIGIERAKVVRKSGEGERERE